MVVPLVQHTHTLARQKGLIFQASLDSNGSSPSRQRVYVVGLTEDWAASHPPVGPEIRIKFNQQTLHQ